MSYTRGEKERRIMEKSGILKNKLFLYLTEFFAGMSVMAVELGASRLCASLRRKLTTAVRYRPSVSRWWTG